MDHGQRTTKDFDYFLIILYLHVHFSKLKKFNIKKKSFFCEVSKDSNAQPFFFGTEKSNYR